MNRILFFFPPRRFWNPFKRNSLTSFIVQEENRKHRRGDFPGLGRLPPFLSLHVTSLLPPRSCVPAHREQLLLGWMLSTCVVRAATAQRADNTKRQKLREKSKGIWGLERSAKGPEMQPVTGCSENKLSCVLHPYGHFFQGSWLCSGCSCAGPQQKGASSPLQAQKVILCMCGFCCWEAKGTSPRTGSQCNSKGMAMESWACWGAGGRRENLWARKPYSSETFGVFKRFVLGMNLLWVVLLSMLVWWTW